MVMSMLVISGVVTDAKQKLGSESCSSVPIFQFFSHNLKASMLFGSAKKSVGRIAIYYLKN